MKLIRQGDILLKPVTTKISGEWKESKEVLVAIGEATNHHHKMYAMPDGMLAELILENKKYLKVKGEAEFWHETSRKAKADHEMLRVPEGTYEIVTEREYDPFASVIKRVVD